MLSKQKLVALFTGYTRSNYVDEIPEEIILLFTKWYQNCLTIVIDGDLMKEFLSKETHKPLAQTFTTRLSDEIPLQCSIIPNNSDAMVRLQLKVYGKSIYDAHLITFYLENCCEEINNSTFKETKKINLGGADNSGTVKQQFFPLSLAKNKKKLTFHINAELICYHSDATFKPIYFSKSPVYSSHIEYKWVLQDDALFNFKNCNLRQWIYSPNFMDGCIGIFCQPLSCIGNTNHLDMILGVEFYKIPNEIRDMTVKVKFQTNIPLDDADGDEFICYEDIEEEVVNGSTFYVNNFKYRAFKEFMGDILNIKVSIDVVEVNILNQDGDVFVLEKSEWYKYGVSP